MGPAIVGVAVRRSRRSLPFGELAPVLAVPGVRFVLLQAPPTPLEQEKFVALAAELGDLADTAAAIAALDLLIAVDSPALHLAGAMGHLGWALLGPDADWRWMVNRADTPWYPSLQLFRPSRAGSAGDSIPHIATLLHRLASSSESGRTSDM